MATRRPRKTPPLARQAAELAVAVPQVIAHRLTRLALSFLRAFGSPARPKASAASATRRVGRAVTGIVQAGLAPVHRCAVANAKRLSRTQRQ